ncbi:sugar phosphate isomerase/epimerase family protein [Vibrio viridaestus]|uniref:Sugar phosphate isomerase/epimerase n=1 Tax=Vibrio viridaestus TaxID=2487322 RepID=A0A3N9TAI2_9VIBR|nr:sugar phosphate isomerase/epimerase family protein [Vibrio viridaestus]RQW61108.1 sugar phosphate isomerase/epimerase [Vibrio viridaestus]
MIKALHGISTNYCNVMTETRIAHETGYDALEFIQTKLLRYLDNGGTTKALKQRVDSFGLNTACVNALLSIERHQVDERKEMLQEAERLTQIAHDLECPTVQILPLFSIDHLPQESIMKIMMDNIDAISDIGLKYGVQYQIEIITETQFNTVEQAKDIIDTLDKGNIGIVVDFWHLHCSGYTADDIAKLSKDIIYGVHFCDGRRPYPGEVWDEMIQRNYFPGEGDVDIQGFTDAVKSTGFDGVWSTELFSPNRWEDDLWDAAKACIDNMTKYTG